MKIKNIYAVFISLFILFFNLLVQGQVNTLWTKTFGGIGADVGKSVQQTTDGGYIITGYTESFGAGGYDVWLIKTDDAGDTLWTRTFGGNSDDYGYSVQQTEDGGYIIAGGTKSFGSGDSDVWLIKTDGSGDTIWTKAFGGIANDGGNSVQQTTDGGYIIVGYISYTINPPGFNDVWLIKTNASGDTLWTKIFGNINGDEGNSVEQTTDGGYIIAGTTAPAGSPYSDVLLVKTNASGNKLWSKMFYYGSTYAFGKSVRQTPDGGYIIVGYTLYNFNSLYLIKTDSSGNKNWEKFFFPSSWCAGYSVQLTRDGKYIITGRSGSSSDVWLINSDISGNMLWSKTFGGNYNDVGNSVQQTTDDGFIIAGYTESFGAGGGDVWLIKTSPDISDVEPNDARIPSDFSLSQNYPNPFNPATTISYEIPQTGFVSLKVYDLLGREIATLVNEEEQAGSYEVEFTGSELTSGIYFYQLKAGNYSETKKMILLR